MLILAAATLLTWLLGAVVRARRWPDRWPLALIAVLTLATAVAVATGREPGVHTGAYLSGIVVGAIGLAGLPLTAYYALGRFMPSRVALIAVWLISLAPLALGWILVAYITAALVGCPPDAYECPS